MRHHEPTLRTRWLRLDRSTIDQVGARKGDIFAASMQLGDITIVLRNIATLRIDAADFKPFETDRNKAARVRWAGVSMLAFLIALAAGAWYGVMSGSGPAAWRLPLGLAIGAGLVFLFTGGAAMFIASKMNRVQAYYSLTIGVTDMEKVRLVDDNRAVLEQIRDFVLQKINTNDLSTVGRFDLSTDTLILSPPVDRLA